MINKKKNMNIREIRKQFDSACFAGKLDDVKKIITSHSKEELIEYPDNCEALSWAFRRKHFDVVEYLLTNPDVKQDVAIPSYILDNLPKFNKSVTEYLCENEKIKSKVHVFKNNDRYGKIFRGACEHSLDQVIERLAIDQKSKGFWKEKIGGLSILADKKNTNIRLFNLVIEQIVANKNYDHDLLQYNLRGCLTSCLDNENLELANYLIIDKNLQISENERDIIREYFKLGENLFLMREMNESLTKNIATTKKAHKI